MNEFAKTFVADFAKTLNALVKIDADGNKQISITEVGAALLVVITNTMRNYSNAIFAIEEIKGAFTGAENAPARAELVGVFAEAFDLDNDVLEQLIEDTLLFAVAGYDLVTRWGGMVKKGE